MNASTELSFQQRSLFQQGYQTYSAAEKLRAKGVDNAHDLGAQARALRVAENAKSRP